MADDQGSPRWPTGWVMLAGLLVGALAGWLAEMPPVGMVTGLAVGVGIDSLLNHWLNEVPAERQAGEQTHGEQAR